MEAQRYPDDYDGIVAGDYAGIDWTALMFGCGPGCIRPPVGATCRKPSSTC